jgi:hypothetical protein
MGRPIKEKYFGNRNTPYSNQAVGGTTGLGGEGANVITVSNSGTLYSQGTTVAISAPQIPGGVSATISTTINSAGNIAVTKLTNGTGYTSAPTLTVTTASIVTQYVTNSGITATNTISVASVVGIAVGMRVFGGGNGGRVVSVDPVLNRVTSSDLNSTSWTNANNLAFYDQGSAFASSISLTSSMENAIRGLAFVPGGSAKLFDIKKQEGSKRYLVNTADGRAICKLVASPTIASGEMNIIAADTNGSTYFVKKLTARRAVLVQSTASTAFLFADGSAAGWTLDAASLGVVSVSNN